MTIILRNRAQCVYCDDILESTFRHDYRTCSCGKAMVDGGRAYLRHNLGQRDLSVTIPSFDDMSAETTRKLINDFEEWNEAFKAKEEEHPDRADALRDARLAMYDRFFNKYGWIERIKHLSTEETTNDIQE